MSEFELASKVSKEEVGGKKGKKAKTTAAPAVDTTPIVEQKPPANAAGLMSMFSDQGREKFARAFKPVEVEKKIIETPKEVAENQAELDERKQRKLEKRKINRMAEREAKAAAAGGESVVVKPAAAAAPVAAPIAVVDNKKGKETAKPAPAAVAAKPVATTSVAKPAAAKPAATTKPVPILPPTARSATIIPAPGSVVKSDDKNQKKRKAEEIAEDKPTTPEEEGATAADTEGVGAEVPSADLVDPKTNPRTLFIGNITIKFESKDIEKLFQPFGAVESIRLRSVPIAGTKVDEAGNQNLVKKVCVQKKLLGEQKGSLNAYLVFKEEESVGKAIKAMNNTVVEGRHLRVDRATPTLFDPKRSIFIGGLPYYADEEEVRTFFAEALENGQDDIEGVRIVRDNETLKGKGIGYLLFKERDCVLKALSKHETIFKKRWTLRVSSCGKRTKRTGGGNGSDDPRGKRPRFKSENPALKRINLKGVDTKKKLLNKRKQSGTHQKNAKKKRTGGGGGKK